MVMTILMISFPVSNDCVLSNVGMQMLVNGDLALTKDAEMADQ